MLKIAARFFCQELKKGDFIILISALIIAVTAITTVNLFSERIDKVLVKEAANFLGADLMITSTIPIADSIKKAALHLNLKMAEVLTYATVVSVNSHLQLVNVDAVSDTYFLMKQLPTSLNHETVWVDKRLLPLLQIKLQDKIKLGQIHFKVINFIPENVNNINTTWLIAPRVIMLLKDLNNTKIIIPGSKIEYKLLLQGNGETILRFKKLIQPTLTSGQLIFDKDNQPFVLKNIYYNIEQFFILILLASLLITSITILMITRHYLNTHYQTVALLRTLGARWQQLFKIFFYQWFFIAFIAGIIGVSLAYYIQSVLGILLTDFIPFQLPKPSLTPFFLGILLSFSLLFLLILPVFMILPKIPPLYLLRQEITHFSFPLIIIRIGAFLLLALLVIFLFNFNHFALFLLDLFILIAACLYLIGQCFLILLKTFLPMTRGILRRGIHMLLSHSASVLLQITIYTLILMSLLILKQLGHNLIVDWQNTLQKGTPNYFAFNIGLEDITPLEQLFKKYSVKSTQLYPMIRGRLTTLNDQPILSVIPKNGREHNALHRELNLSTMQQLPNDNKIIIGKPFNNLNEGQALISIEKSLADHLNLKLGDKLGFQISGETVNAVIYNIRSVNWASFQPNFYVIFPPKFLKNYLTTYIMSFYLNPHEEIFLNHLAENFPNITIIDVAFILKQIQNLVEKLSLGMQYLLFFATGGAILMFAANLKISLIERRFTYRLLKILGASKFYRIGSLIMEFSLLILLVMVIAYSLSYLSLILIKKLFIF